MKIKVFERTVPLKDFNKWIKALRSGKYKQTTGKLEDHNGFCCLGVACEVLVPKKLLKRNREGCITGVYPRDQCSAPLWLKEIESDFTDNKDAITSIALLNDSGEYSFNEIADILELIYIHKALGDL